MTVDLQLTGMRALVTRGTKGIGVSVVEALYDAGARVVTTARTVPGQRSLYRGGPDERGRSPRGLRSTRLANRRRGAPERTRTSGLRFRKPSLYPAELRGRAPRSEEHTSELQSLMRISYAVFCLIKKTKHR